MTQPLSRFKHWLIKQRAFRVAWFNKDPQITPESEEALSQLPDDVADELLAAVNNLPSPSREADSVLEALDDAIAQWQQNPHLANNSMVILAHPVSSVARILTNSLEKLETHRDSPLSIKFLDWTQRPPDLSNLKQQIQEKLSWGAADNGSSGSKTEEKGVSEKGLCVIPNLCWCFLRSAEGLDGIDYLQETLLNDRMQFWVIGCGHVSWEYLKCTLQLHAYCGDTVALPKLTGEQLQDWLAPIVKQFDLQFNDAALHKRLKSHQNLLEDNLSDTELSIDKPIQAISEITSELAQEVSATAQSSLRAFKNEVLSNKDDESEVSPQRDYFDRLADISDGISIVALQIFVKSLRCQKMMIRELSKKILDQNVTGSEPDSSGISSADHQLVAIVPKLPPLPALSQSDFYLLYSLMLHGDLTIKALANTLGDPPQVVNNQVQVLRNADVIEQKDKIIKVNPMHYPRLRRELSRNNFMIEVP